MSASELSSNGIIAKNLELFDDEKVGAVGFSLKNMKYENTIKQLAPDKHRGDVISELLEGELALRRKMFLSWSFLMHCL